MHEFVFMGMGNTSSQSMDATLDVLWNRSE